MSATVIQRTTVRLGSYALTGPLLFLATSVILSALSRRAVTHLASWHLQSAMWSNRVSFLVVCAALAGAIALRSIRYQEFSRPLRIVMRGIGVIVLVQVVFDSFGPFAGPANILFGNGDYVLFYRYGAIFGILSGAFAIWRPSFLVPLFFFYAAWRAFFGKTTGVAIVPTDYLGMLDVGYFSVVGGLVTVCATAPRVLDGISWLRRLVANAGTLAEVRDRTFGLIWSCAVGAHLGSYLWSGLTKIGAGGSAPWTWLLHNPTQTSIVIGLERGDNPLATWPWLLQFIWDGIVNTQPFMNIFVLGTQLLSPLAAISPIILSVFCILFDLFHIGVYLTLGALFFFWIAVNLIIASAAVTIPRNGFTPAMRIVMVAATIFGHAAFYTNDLGWLDAAKLASPQFYAETRDGHQILVPSNYFGIFSYTIAQTGMYIPDNSFRFLVGGNNPDRRYWEDSLTCGPLTVPHQDTGVTLGTVQSMVLQTDTLMRRHPWVKKLNLYYLYPHHMLPNPLVFGQFNHLAMDDIVGYYYVVDSVCLSLRDGRLVRDVRRRWTSKIDLAK